MPQATIYANTVGKPLRRTLFRSRVWRSALVRAGMLGTRTVLVDDGVPVNIVQRVTGHERSSTTLDLYTRRTDDHGRILRALDEMMTSADDQRCSLA